MSAAPESSGPGPGPAEVLGVHGDPSLPGVADPSSELDALLQSCLLGQGDDYSPRTEHLREDGAPRFTNRLVCQTSPYLLQHAHNPVNWYPWGDDAFERARERGVPVFLSVGYSTCHWCHVMERESFENEEVAAFINEHFVAIKVDREERPDVDDVYMTAVQLLSGSGGWPMTLALTPDREPFFGGTYFPPASGSRGAGLMEILDELASAYQAAPDEVAQQAAEVTARITEANAPVAPIGLPPAQVVVRAVTRLARAFDPEWGGFGSAPKFPRPVTPELLLRYHRRTADPSALAMVVRTLEAMATGGMRDHVGGGFHRYSTDRYWSVPHFEKMLYDNAQLATLYLAAWQSTGRDDFAEVVRSTLDYVAREMTHEQGGFYSATDADSLAPSGEREEGWFFTWTEEELRAALGEEDARIAVEWWGHGRNAVVDGRMVFAESAPLPEVAGRLGISEPDLAARIETLRHRLREVRAERPAPLLDDKVITAWNGLMISAFARAGLAFGDASYVERARRAARFVLEHLRDAEGRLFRSWRAGSMRSDAVLDDHAFLIAGLLDLFEADADPIWLREAISLQESQDRLFADDSGGGYYLTPTEGEELLARSRPIYDGAEPSGNSVATMNLLRLATITGDDTYRQRAEALLTAFSGELARSGAASPLLLSGVDRLTDDALEVVIVVPPGGASGPLVEVARRQWLPHATLLISEEAPLADIAALAPFVAGKVAESGAPTAYVCRRGACERPTTDPDTLRELLARSSPYPGMEPPAPLPEPAPPEPRLQ